MASSDELIKELDDAIERQIKFDSAIKASFGLPILEEEPEETNDLSRFDNIANMPNIPD